MSSTIATRLTKSWSQARLWPAVAMAYVLMGSMIKAHGIIHCIFTWKWTSVQPPCCSVAQIGSNDHLAYKLKLTFILYTRLASGTDYQLSSAHAGIILRRILLGHYARSLSTQSGLLSICHHGNPPRAARSGCMTRRRPDSEYRTPQTPHPQQGIVCAAS